MLHICGICSSHCSAYRLPYSLECSAFFWSCLQSFLLSLQFLCPLLSLNSAHSSAPFAIAFQLFLISAFNRYSLSFLRLFQAIDTGLITSQHLLFTYWGTVELEQSRVLVLLQLNQVCRTHNEQSDKSLLAMHIALTKKQLISAEWNVLYTHVYTSSLHTSSNPTLNAPDKTSHLRCQVERTSVAWNI